ncbi:glycine zipper 2TM domain-containing protein [Lysobacter sp. LF1]|uniref:Glycine zipper 2TM domain-containing protein n=1 Tax=Lysobacter stagni TaxID=3045172 RepID=A0ABT6XC99_9GAMM|nr:glycine zipper 2TM domain-containing protein [Lysobacter sp. LF1]MDI9237774.1 glycine zipper 2TM domain-containing protein [Lysobacter sp. LF1]
MNVRLHAFALCLVLVLPAAPGVMAQTVGRSEVGTARSVEWGKVRRVLAVNIQNDNRGVGTATGAALGGIAGSTIGGGRRANTAGAVAGAVAGGAVGNRMARGGRQGIEVTVELESGRTIAVTQEGSVNEFRVGDRVQVSSDGANTRVSR